MAMLYLSLLPTPLAAASDGLAAHLLLEALKQAFAMRMSLGDPSFVPDVQQVPRYQVLGTTHEDSQH